MEEVTSCRFPFNNLCLSVLAAQPLLMHLNSNSPHPLALNGAASQSCQRLPVSDLLRPHEVFPSTESLKPTANFRIARTIAFSSRVAPLRRAIQYSRVFPSAYLSTMCQKDDASYRFIREKNGARCRVRTCDFLRVKQALYH